MILVSGNKFYILYGYSQGFSGEGASNDSGVIENVDFQGFRTLLLRQLRKWGQHYYTALFNVAFPLTPKFIPNPHSTKASATLDWNSQRPQVAVPLARNPHDSQATATRAANTACQWPHVSKTTATHVQFDYDHAAVKTWSSSSRHQSDCCLEKFCPQPFSSTAQHHSLSTSSAHQLNQQQLSLSHQQFAPISYEQQRSPVTAASDAQLSVPALSVAAAVPSDSALPRGLINDGNLCFVSCVLQSLAVVKELVSAVQLTTKRLSIEPNDSRPLISSLSDVLSAIYEPCDQSCGQSTTPVNPDKFLAAVSGQLPSESEMIAGHGNGHGDGEGRFVQL